MMNRLEPLRLVTRQLRDVLAEEPTAEARDVVIEEATRLLEERRRLIAAVLPPYSTEEQIAGQEIVQMDAVIQRNMDQLFSSVKADVMTVKKQKKSSTSYSNPYKQTASSDGMFLDHKK